MVGPRASRAPLPVQAGAAALAPAVIFFALFNDVVFANVEALRYHPPLVAAFAGAFLAATAAGLWVVRRAGVSRSARAASRLLLALPWMVLVWDAAGSRLDASPVSYGVLVAADVVIAAAVLAAARAVSFERLQALAAAAAAVILVHGVVAHARFAATLPSRLVSGAAPERPAGGPPPEVRPQGNVYHLVLDTYQSETFEHLAGPTAAAEYGGFTFFTRYNTNFPRTNSAGWAMMLGRPPRRNESVREWMASAPRAGFWRDLAAGGAGLWVYPLAENWCPPAAIVCSPASEVGQAAQQIALRGVTIDLWFQRLLPASLRRALNGGPIRAATIGFEESAGFSVTTLARGLAAGRDNAWRLAARGISPHPLQFFSIRQFERMLADESRRPARGQYVFYHGLIPHAPYLMDERCEIRAVVESENPGPQSRALSEDGDPEYWAFAECANALIKRLTRTLDRLGRLQDAMIVVHADHGDLRFVLGPRHTGKPVEFALDPIARRYQTPDEAYQDVSLAWSELHAGDSARWRPVAIEVASSGLLLIRFPGDRPFTRDSRPVQMIDLAPTILDHFGLAWDRFAGVPIPSLAADDPRENLFYAHGREVEHKLSKYRLSAAGWEFVEDIPLVP